MQFTNSVPKNQSRDSNAAISLVNAIMFVYGSKPWRVKLNLQNEKSSIFLFRKFSARKLQTNYLFKTVSKRYFSHRLVLGVRKLEILWK